MAFLVLFGCGEDRGRRNSVAGLGPDILWTKACANLSAGPVRPALSREEEVGTPGCNRKRDGGTEGWKVGP